MARKIPKAAIQAAAEVRLRQYESEYSAAHLTWKDFADDTRAMLEAAAPHMGKQRPANNTARLRQWATRQAQRQTNTPYDQGYMTAVRAMLEIIGPLRSPPTGSSASS